MKKIVLALTFLLLATACYSQAPVPPAPITEPPKGTKEYYLEKRESNMVRGWILTPVGVALIGLGTAMAWSEIATGITTLGRDSKNSSTPGLLVAVGIGSVLGGTVSFISARKNRRKARAMAVGYEQVPLPLSGTLIAKAVPTVGLKVSF
ncbi:hypothetical protein [Sabulibacter ruber]|uniref:hypothetical protein n=1 Tax=Sabulibacter ruber TaxID=2811901 RepID=UPI001A95B463|nr:hypothetical protein [Sabulibacter ruber]